MIKIFSSALNSLLLNTETLDWFPLPTGVSDYLESDEIVNGKKSTKLSKRNLVNDNKEEIVELVLLIAQTCNLKCSYCFADSYMKPYSNKRVMSPDTARVAIEKVFKYVTDLKRVLFFGGEPLIGFATIKKAVQAIEKYCMAHQRQLPVFSITTNGILIDRAVVEFFKRYNFSVTVSLDGPKHINDKQRKLPSGKGTYATVKRKIDLLQKANIEIAIEAVFTENHKSFKESIEATHEFLLKLGPRNVYLTPAIGWTPDESPDRDLLSDLEQSYMASTEKIMDSWLTDSPLEMAYWFDIVQTLLSRKCKTHFCGAGYKRIIVDYLGNIFPCYLLIDDLLFMGNVHDIEFPDNNFRRVTSLLRRTSKDTFPTCRICWAKNLCSPCYGDTFNALGTLSPPSERICVIIRSVAKAILLKVAEFASNDKKWKKFRENLNRMQESFDSDYIK